VYSRTVGVGDGVGVGVGVGVATGAGVGGGVTTTEGVGDGVGVGATAEGVGVIVTEGVGVALTTGAGDKEGVGEVVGTALTTTPRFQTLLFPRLTQVNSRFLETTTVPTFLHDAPALGEFAEALLRELAIKNEESRMTMERRILKF
jgi:hypothetical protein